ncbi:DUF1292 domain-containing protein [Brevibacillus sp. B_LB10_24]|uniref:DUF1292 domain-containing protein n=1 Tax=Brevibacillus sp. B_LB10_24 TaxID=3380645 RepID=UPI0038B8409F
MSKEMENNPLEVGDVITLDDENGEEIGEFEIVAIYEMGKKQYVALTPASEDEEASEDMDEEIDIFVLGLDGEELVPLEEDEEDAAYAKLNEILDDIELTEHDHDHDHK